MYALITYLSEDMYMRNDCVSIRQFNNNVNNRGGNNSRTSDNFRPFSLFV